MQGLLILPLYSQTHAWPWRRTSHSRPDNVDLSVLPNRDGRELPPSAAVVHNGTRPPQPARSIWPGPFINQSHPSHPVTENKLLGEWAESSPISANSRWPVCSCSILTLILGRPGVLCPLAPRTIQPAFTPSRPRAIEPSAAIYVPRKTTAHFCPFKLDCRLMDTPTRQTLQREWVESGRTEQNTPPASGAKSHTCTRHRIGLSFGPLALYVPSPAKATSRICYLGLWQLHGLVEGFFHPSFLACVSTILAPNWSDRTTPEKNRKNKLPINRDGQC